MDHPEVSPENSMIGRRVGAYLLSDEIGRGGMGAVYRARRADGEFDQTVAVKLIKRGMDTDMILRRFRRERQILASLNHPNIAYFLGGGSTEDGLPYFVMEYIDGLPLYKYCNRKRLTTNDRLVVFRQVCWAVAAAHEARIVHRDLKPSNIIVKGDGKPKLLDFGIAKLLDPDLSATDNEPTATHMRAMTPEYASPEQIVGDTVGPASDIYSLGVILYELLSGHRPYRFRRQVPEEIARLIREEMPTNPSASVTSDQELVPDNGGLMTAERLFEGRSATPEILKRELAGDLDKIVLKAMRKDPVDRYRTVMDLADDITNYLEGRPVRAEFFVTRTSIAGMRKPGSLSIAILPFKVMSSQAPGETGSEFVGIGMADALISRLSGLPRLIVRPTTSVLPFSDSNPFEAAKQLGVDYILDGNVRIVGGRIRVSVQLYRASENTTEWAKAFDKDVGDVLELEDALAEQVTASLLPQLSADERDRLGRRGTNKPGAYEAYIRGRYFWSRFTEEGLDKAVGEFNKAIGIDPDYAHPYIGLADYYIWAAIFGQIPSAQGFPKAIDAARKALQINDTLGEAYAVLSFCVFLYDWNWTDAEYLIKRAIELNPHYSIAHEYYSNFLIAQRRFDEGLKEMFLAEQLDPVSPRTIIMTAWTLYQTRRYDEALEKAKKAASMSKGNPQALLHLGNTLAATGNLEEAVEALRKSAETWSAAGLPRYMLACVRSAQGDRKAVDKILNKLIETANESYMKPYFVGMAAVAAGDHDLAFEWFDRAVEERNEWLLWFGTEPKLDAIRSDPRYTEILRKTNNPILKGSHPDNSESPDTAERERSIAVLPFKVIRAEEAAESKEDEYLSIGLADSVTMRLSNIRKFLVRPTSSVLQFAKTESDPFASGEQLGVDFVVDGIIRHVGDRIRVTAQLLNVAEGSTRWSASFSEKFTDVLELEDSIAGQVTKSLLPKLTGEGLTNINKRGTKSPEAHDAYLQGRFFWNQFEIDSFPKALKAFKRAVELDPEYALAHAGLADYHTWACIYGMESPAEGFPKVFESATRAIEIDSSLAEAYAALGLYYSNAQEWDRAEEFYRRGLELNPSYPLGHEWLSAILMGTGRFEEGAKEIRMAEGLDPLSLRPKVLTSWTLYQARDYEGSLQKARELWELNPDFMQSHMQLANVLLEMGETGTALEHARRAVELEPDSPLPVYGLTWALMRSGLAEEANDLVDKWTEISKDEYVAPYFLAMCREAIGDRDFAIQLLRESVDENSAWILWLGTEPKLDAMRDDDRYKALLKSTKNPIYGKLYSGGSES